MLPKKTRRIVYALLLMTFSVVCTSAIAGKKAFSVYEEVASAIKAATSSKTGAVEKTALKNSSITEKKETVSAAAAPMFATIIQGYDDVDNCTSDGSTIARFILCGDSDDRNITLSTSGSVSWQRLTGAAPNTNLPCPNTNGGDYTEVSTASTFNLDASSISAATGAEYRVQVNGGQYYYFEVIKSTITQSYTKKDFVCNNPGRIEITGLPNSYQFRIREASGTFGPYQSSSIFPNLDPGFYTVQARLNIAGEVCEYLYDVIEIKQVDIEIDVTYTNPVCSGETGSIDVTVNPEVPGPYVYTLLDENGVEIEFTSTISSNTYTFGAVSEGTYAVKVETNDCKEDIPNGIPAPIQYTDTSGNAITVGTGLSPISVVTDTNGMSFGCSTISSVDIDVTPSGGSGSYSYTVSDGGDSGGFFSGTSSYTVTSPGTYTFYITDDQGCTAEKSEYVAELTPPDVTAAPIIGTCTNGGGKVDFNVSDPKGFNLEFRATNNAGDPFTSSPTIPVTDDTYTIVEVRYSQGAFSCVLSLPAVTVTSAGGLSGSASLTQDYTCINGGGIIDFTPATGGSGSGYEYSIDNVTYQSGTTFTGLAPGSYIPYIKDDAGCFQALSPIDITEPTPPGAITFAQDNLDCATGTSTVTIDVLPAGFATQYEVISAIPAAPLSGPQASNVFNGLRLDTSYQFEITDANGCTYTASFTTGGFSSIRARVKSGGDRKVCPGATDGNGAFLVDGFATDYDYAVVQLPATPVVSGTSSDLEIPITGLGAGTYEITVTDNDTNCTSTVSFDVEEAATVLSVNSSVTDMSCQNNNIGRVVGSATGGFGGYRYELEWPPSDGRTDGPKTGGTFGNLTEEGTYTLTVTDSEGCSASTTFTLTSVDAPAISFDSADYCYTTTNDAEITVSSTPGSAAIGTHQYRINGGALVTPGTPGTHTFTGLVPGNYTIEVVDGNGCIASTSAIRIPPQLQVSLSLNREIDCGGDGEMQITITGGDITDLSTTSYTIYRDGTAVASHTGLPLPSGSFTYNMLFTEFGDYTVEVSDSNGCSTISEPLTFVEPTNIIATHRIVGPSCGDANSGFVEIIPDVASGVPPFEVVFAPAGELVANPLDPNNPSGTDPINYAFSSQTIYSGLAAGSYEYVVKDARNCVTAVTPVEVVTDPVLAPDATVNPIDATCAPAPLSGGVIVDLPLTPAPGAGVPDYTVIVEDNFGNPLVTLNNVVPGDFPLTIEDSSLEPGDYQVIVLDSRGCRDIEPFTINSGSLDIIPEPFPGFTCTASGTTVCVNITGGTMPLDYSIRLTDPDPLAGWTSPSSPPDRHCFNNLLFGVTYTVDVRDNNTGCIYSEEITLPTGPGTDVTLASDYRCGVGEVELRYTVGSGVAPFDIVITDLDTGAVVHTETGVSPVLGTEVIVPTGVDLGRYGISIVDANGCTDGATVDTFINLPRVDVIDNQNANCNALGQLTVRGSGGTPFASGSPYLYAFMPAGTPPTNADFSDAATVGLPGSLTGIDYDIWVKDANDCAYRISAAIIQLNPDLPLLDPVVENQCDVTATAAGGFDITLSLPGDFDTPTFTLNGISQTVANSGDPAINTTATFTVNSVGAYDYNIIDANGCEANGVAEVFQVLSASGDFTTEPSCEVDNGVITITADGGSGDFSYRLTGTDIFGGAVDITDPDDDGIFPGIPAGDYQVVVTDNLVDDGANNCTFTIDGIVRSAPVSPDIDDTGESDVSCNGADDGSISASLIAGTDVDGIKEYNLYSGTIGALPSNLDTSSRINTNLSGSFTALAPGTYVIEVVTDRDCFDREEVVINEPPPFEIDVTSGTLVCNPAANQYSTTIVSAAIVGGNVGNGAPYGYKINLADSYQSSPDFEIVDTGSDQVITIYARDSNGCEFFDSVTVLAPNTVTATITQISPMDCENPERIRIDVTGSTNFIIEDQGFSVAPVADQAQPSGSFVEFDLPMVAGEYNLRVNDIGGCSYPIVAYVVDEPVLPTVSISQNEPVGCFGTTDGILNIEITNLASLTNFSGVYEYTVYDASDPGFSGGAFGSPVGGNSTGTIDATVNNPATITGLEGGNLRVVIREQGKSVTTCDVFSNMSTIEMPNEQLLITNMEEIGRVGCDDNLGEIFVTTQGGWDSSPYEYMLEYENPVGSGFAPHSNAAYASFAANGTNNRFTGLASGNYRVTVRDIEGCTHTAELELLPVAPIEADAIVTRELECPTGNDAVIVAVEPGTTIPGAIGGVPGGGYQYRLLHLGSNDITDIESSTGLQTSPEFVGTAGTGVIPGGWYAIEVVSTLNCSVITAPVQVIPPPAINPALIQTSVPACGNEATMMIRVNNPQGGTYEFSVNGSGGPWLPIDEVDGNGLPVKTGLPGVIGNSYRYEVRKVGSASSCLARKTNGITITDAEPLSLDPASPTFDVSCAYEVDGRIEAIANGGTGIYEFRIYDYDPGADAFAAESMPTYRSLPAQDFGTFENLDAGDYWISVISRATCGLVEGPFTIAPAVPVVLSPTSTPTTCYGASDGTITMTVDSGASGLVQFAIEPNLSEFFSDPDNPTTYTFTDLPANTPSNPSYTVLAQDAEGCPQTFEIIVTAPEELQIVDFSSTPETCIGFEDGTARLNVTGGTPFVDPVTFVEYYETRLVGPNSDGTEVFLRNDDLSFDSLIGGEGYIVYVRDANMCETNVFIPIEIGVDLTADPLVQYGCEGIFPNSTASVQMQDESLLSELLFALDPIDPTDAITALAGSERSWGDLPAGDHTVYIYHENGCTNFIEFTIEAYDPLTLTAEKTGPNEITATAEGGFGGYEFFFDGVSYGSSGLYTTTESGTVEIKVVDQNGCEAIAVIPFEFTGMLEIPNFFTPNGDNENDFWAPGNREFFPNIEVIIYDRYGRVVAELDQVSNWDGRYEGKELPSGDYWYVVNQNDDRDIRYVGHFTLYR
ncbi:T9SS type B sorting domain-containing protein [Zobellia uliginosa]|uniref:T9SS type B sorting domain-containing protein n=1 Tax=Zobellia uliginosa TaxID=143224 RepID=UPI0026E1699D|nr:T9SS type B sorting domain-containing protein [Zobellia uliginosa]MDO6518316.1 T9SS type B sorting domain-containing protein [Zobellia uliginosa]